MIHSYADCDTACRRGGTATGAKVDARTIANNTRVIRDGLVFHIRLHDTNILTYGADGSVRYDSGGWLTMVTKERMNEFGPSDLRVISVNGRWHLAQRSSDGYGYEHLTVPFVDGVVVMRTKDVWLPAKDTGLTMEELLRENRHNKQIDKLITRYMRGFTPDVFEALEMYGRCDDDGQASDVPKCPLCLTMMEDVWDRTRTKVVAVLSQTVGDRMGDTQHLIEHMIEKHYHRSLVLAAMSHCGYTNPIAFSHYDSAKRSLRKYLRARLYVGAVATQHGRRPIDAKPWSLARAYQGVS